MFTGIVVGMGRVAELRRTSFGARLVVNPQGLKLSARPGDSVCVSGCCLTVAPGDRAAPHDLSFDVIQETLAKTMLGKLRVGDAVNLEPSLTANTPMGGHFVQGHVDGVGAVTRVISGVDEWRVTVRPPPPLMPFVIPKGSVAIAGVSLTLAGVTRDTFEVALIPTTLRLTTLASLKVGDGVNLEADIVAKTIVHWLQMQFGEGGLSMDKLRAAGFLS